MEKINNKSLDLTKVNIEKLKELFPNVVTEGKIDFDALRTVLSNEVDDSKEKYQFTWKGKSNAIKLSQTPSSATLRPDKESSKNWDTTENLYIEGDNLEVLKQLQKTYYGKIKMIYIDPPYNTGNDFVYKDDFKNSIENYKKQTNQVMSSNPETNGRYHTDWLNMIYPRLMLAKNLLKDDGVIFISIDDTEVEKLKLICNEIFGETNFLAQIIWERAYAPVNLKKHFSESHDYILCYAKNKESCVCNGLPRTESQNNDYKNIDNDPRGPWKAGNPSVGPAVEKNIYEIISPTGRKMLPPSGRSWLYTKEKFKELLEDNRIYWGKDGNSIWAPKMFLSEVKQGVTPMTIWKYQEVGHSQEASQYLKKLFGGKAYFDYPKSVRLIKQCINLYTNEDDIILDFFSGSSTTTEAVMQLNMEQNTNRKFIMVQLPEKLLEKTNAYQDGYRSICDIARKRIDLAGEKIKQEWLKKNQGEGLFVDEQKEFPFDIGFKVFTLDSTNIRPWDNENEMDEDTLFNSVDIFKEGRSKEDILYEIMLKYGIFDMPANEIDVNEKTMYRVGKRYMIVCLEDDITNEDIQAIANLSPKTVVFKESGFKNDNDKINAVYNLEKAGVEDIKCI
ncbi:site-specific DNA-methyltransferase [Thomasclavelia cocleata]|uniref:site-specific DNA-methyltransferase n=1 Tax=Thomasclavelia cocleata TaxID=69824 RepID=UPI0024324D51|nr:site-specific DNA-methyltransferase [Thomasclavelia cocleata]